MNGWERRTIMARITKIEARSRTPIRRKRVAAYCRVSKDTDRLMHSVVSQISYYSNLIQNNPEWEYAGVYADEGITGTDAARRPEFQRMLEDAEKGTMDLILTKSISRFARNTVDLLNIVRHLKDIGVEIRFEEQNISTFSGDGELMMTILGSFAQAESESISQNIKWSKKKQAEKGQMTNKSAPYGYQVEDRHLVIIPEEAEVVRRVFSLYTNEKKSTYEIAGLLNADKIPGQRGGKWTNSSVLRMLRNEAYGGDQILLKYYVADPLKHHMVRNHGEKERYLVENAHEAIIDKDTYEKTQIELERRSQLGIYANTHVTHNEFTRRVICKGCGHFFSRQNSTALGEKIHVWSCKRTEGKCMTPSIPEETFRSMFCEVMDMNEYDPEKFSEVIDHIEVGLDDTVVFYLKDGSTREIRFHRKTASPIKTRKEISDYFRQKIYCEKCGNALKRRITMYCGIRKIYWRCPVCRGKFIREDDLKNCIESITGREFENVQNDIDYLRISSDRSRISIFLLNEKVISGFWNPPVHRGATWSEEKKREARESGKYRWSEERRRKARERRNGKKSQDDTSNIESIHGNSGTFQN